MIISILGNGLVFKALRAMNLDRLHKSKAIKVVTEGGYVSKNGLVNRGVISNKWGHYDDIDALLLHPTVKQVSPARTEMMVKHLAQYTPNK